MATTEDLRRTTKTTILSSTKNSVWKKPARLSPGNMAVIIPEQFVELFHIDDDLTWLQMIPTSDGVLMKPVNGMPSSEKEN
jgi:hypothetical protein